MRMCEIVESKMDIADTEKCTFYLLCSSSFAAESLTNLLNRGGTCCTARIVQVFRCYDYTTVYSRVRGILNFQRIASSEFLGRVWPWRPEYIQSERFCWRCLNVPKGELQSWRWSGNIGKARHSKFAMLAGYAYFRQKEQIMTLGFLSWGRTDQPVEHSKSAKWGFRFLQQKLSTVQFDCVRTTIYPLHIFRAFEILEFWLFQAPQVYEPSRHAVLSSLSVYLTPSYDLG